ncbi:MAG: FAD-binding protein [Bacillota bacterium]|jgi:succinate dehydrogenase/fumarate reductase flavoprotein subunit|nr:FAD-binding protein [Bacillota bacterium]HHU30933.1 FAD-binding protein [Bacillota bacterium]
MDRYGRENLYADILIIGGGVAGLTAAISLKEINPELDVLVVEKQTAGYSGKACRGGGVLQYFDFDKITPEQFVEYHVHNIGCYLGDQELLLKYVSMNNHMLDKLVEWDAKLPKRADGSYAVIPTGPMTGIIGVDLDITIRLRRTAEKMGVKFLDKVTVSDLLTAGNKIAGATGYSILDGTFYTFNAKSVILATGSQNYRIGPMWGSGRGDGIAAAYRAGAEMRNPEFGNFAQLVRVRSHREVVYGENYMYNQLDEHITKNFRSGPEPDISSSAIAEWFMQMSMAKGPIILKPENNGGSLESMWDRPFGAPFWRLNEEWAEKVDEDWEVCPMFIGEQSPVKVDHNMQTTIPGLYAIGDASYCGSAAPGAVPAPPGRNRGSGILNAVFSGIVCAQSAAENANNSLLPPMDKAQVEDCMARAYAPLLRESGCNAKDVIRYIHKAVGPMERSVYMSDHRIATALRYVEKAKELAGSMKASDFHDLLACHEANAMVLSAEMQFRAAAMRTESRGWFLREDYPEMDNKNWLKWIIVKKEGDTMKFSTEAVPYDKWPIKPNV